MPLEINVTDHASQQQASSRHKFYVYREEVRPSSRAVSQEAAYDFLRGLYRESTAEELTEEFKTMRYLTASDDEKIFTALDVSGKREFIAKFWQARDQSPETPYNEFREDYLKRVKFANERFFRPAQRVADRYGARAVGVQPTR